MVVGVEGSYLAMPLIITSVCSEWLFNIDYSLEVRLATVLLFVACFTFFVEVEACGSLFGSVLVCMWSVPGWALAPTHSCRLYNGKDGITCFAHSWYVDC